MNVRVKIKGLDEFKKGLEKSPKTTVQELSKAIKKTVLTIESKAKREAPVNKQAGGGNLRQSIKASMISITRGKVEVGADYGIYVHEGTRPQIIRRRNKKVLANERSGKVFGPVVHHPGTRANPFLTKAVKKSQNQVIKYFQTALENVIKTFK